MKYLYLFLLPFLVLYIHTSQAQSCSSANDVKTLPVVVHLVHASSTPAGQKANMSDSEIEKLIDDLNDNFAHASGAVYANPYSGIDTKIRFELAKRTPDDKPTNGIIKHVSDQHSTVQSFKDEAMMTAYGWDQSSYINIYVLDKLIGNSGYSRFPSTHGTVFDGILFNADALWSGVLTHEMGHFLGLYHTFSDVGSSKNDNCEKDGDQICDTPPKSKAGTNGGTCSSPGNTDVTDVDDEHSRNPYRPVHLGGLGDQPDMLENYMDYTGGCWGAFSHGQSDKMNEVLETIRRSLLSSKGAIPINANEVAINEIMAPTGQVCAGVNDVVVNVTNLGTTNLTAFPVHVEMNGTVVKTLDWTGKIASGASQNITIEDIDFADGTNNIKVYTDWTDDVMTSNNQTCSQVAYEEGIKACNSLTGFESGLGIWNVQNPDNIVAWEVMPYNKCPDNGSSVLAYLSNNGTLAGNSGADDYLVSRLLDLTEATQAELTFDYSHKRTYSNFPTTLSVEVSDDCGVSFNSEFSKSHYRLETVPKTNDHSSFTPQYCNQWKNASIDLSAYAGKNVIIRFHVNIQKSWGQNLYLDNIKLTANCNAEPDCNNEIGGTAKIDQCGVCAGGSTGIVPDESCTDCNGDVNGTAEIDVCGTCTGGKTGIPPSTGCTDCNGDINGTARIDQCGVCAGGNTGVIPDESCLDCNNEINGTAIIDACGDCAGGSTGLTPKAECLDCNGDDHGTAYIDDCGICAGGNTGIVPDALCTDCNGDVNGDAFIDACGDCVAGTTGLEPNQNCLDCNGDINGTAFIDDCGVCAEGNTGVVQNENCTDCEGVLHGTAGMDACGVCHGGTTGVVSKCYDCIEVETETKVFCEPNTRVTLTASTTNNNCAAIEWYEDNDPSSLPIATGCEFLTPPLTGSRSYYIDESSNHSKKGNSKTIGYNYGDSKLFGQMNRWNDGFKTEFRANQNVTLKAFDVKFSNCNHNNNDIRVVLMDLTTGSKKYYFHKAACYNNSAITVTPNFSLIAGHKYQVYIDNSMNREVVGYQSISGNLLDVSSSEITFLRSGDNLNGGFGPFFNWQIPAPCERKEVQVIQRCLEQCGNGIDDDGDGEIDEGCKEFICNGKFFQTIADTLYELNISPIKFTPIAGFPFKLNSTAYNPQDNRIYLMAKTGEHELKIVRVAADGSYEVLDKILKPDGTALSSFSADIGYNGVYYVLENYERVLYEVDIETLLAKPVLKLSTTLADIAYNPEDGCLYGIDGNKYLYKLDPVKGNSVNLGRLKGSYITNGGGIGAVYFIPSGELIAYGAIYSSTSQDDMIKINISDLTVEELIKNGLKVSENDGASCPYTVQIDKTVSVDEVNPGGKFLYTIDVYNKSGFSLYNLDFLDELDDRLTITDIVKNELGKVTFKTGVGTKEIEIEHFQLGSGKSTLEFEVEVKDGVYCQGEFIPNQATISNVPAVLGSVIYSDDPNTPKEKDSTLIEIKSPLVVLDAGSFNYPDETVCHGTTLDLGITGYTGSVVWQTSKDGTNWKDFTGTQIDEATIEVLFENQEDNAIEQYFRVMLFSSCDTIYAENTITVLPEPYTTVSAKEWYICEGDDIELFATNAGTGAEFNWQGPDGFTSTDQNPVITGALKASEGLYSVKVSRDGCDGNEEEVRIDILQKAKATITTNPEPVICDGDEVTLTLSLEDDDASSTTFKWQLNGAIMADEIRTEFISDKLSDNDELTVLINQDDVCESEQSAVVTITPLPEPDLGDDIIECETADLQLSESYHAYDWSVKLNTETITVTASDDYNVTVTKDGCSASDTITVEIHPPFEVDLGEDISVCENSEVVLAPILNNSSQFDKTYEWSTGETTEKIYPTTNDDYSVTVTRGECSAESSVNVEFRELPEPDLGPDKTFCEKGTLSLFKQYDTYLWSTGEDTESIEVTKTGTYSVTVSVDGCEGEDEIKVVIDTPPDFELTDTVMCEGESVELDAGNLGTSYTWSTGETTRKITVDKTDTYEVTVQAGVCKLFDATSVEVVPLPSFDLGSDISACEVFDLIEGSGFDEYLWDDGITSPDRIITKSGVYSVTVTHNGCSSSDAIKIDIDNPVIFDLGKDTSVCDGAEVLLSPGNIAGTFAWSNNSTNLTTIVNVSGTYTLTVTEGMCTSTDDITVTFVPNGTPAITIASDNQDICEGTAVEFTLADSSALGTNPVYEWTVNNVDASDEKSFSSSDLKNNDVVALRVYSSMKCITDPDATDQITMVVSENVMPEIEINAGKTKICDGETVEIQLHDSTGLGETPVYEWYVDGVKQTEISEKIELNTLSVTSNITLRAYSSMKCRMAEYAEATVIVEVVDKVTPNVELFSAKQVYCEDDDVIVSIIDSTGGGDNPTFTWQLNGEDLLIDENAYTISEIKERSVFTVTMHSNSFCADPLVAEAEIEIEVIDLVTPDILIEADKNNICAGETITFSLADSSNGGPAPSFAWFVNDELKSSHVTTYSSPDLQDGDEVKLKMVSSLQCLVAPSDSSIVIADVVLPVTPAFDLVSLPENPCEGETVTFRADNIENQGDNPTFKWFVDNKKQVATASYIEIADLPHNAEIRLEMISDAQCAVPAEVQHSMYVNPKPQFSITVDDLLCSDGAMELIEITNDNSVDGDYSIANFAGLVEVDNVYYIDPTRTQDNEITVSVQWVTEKGCTNEAEAEVTIKHIEPPVAEPSYYDIIDVLPYSVFEAEGDYKLKWYDADKDNIGSGSSYEPSNVCDEEECIYTYYVNQVDQISGCESEYVPVHYTMVRCPVPPPELINDGKFFACDYQEIPSLEVDTASVWPTYQPYVKSELMWYEYPDDNEDLYLYRGEKPFSTNQTEPGMYTYWAKQYNAGYNCYSSAVPVTLEIFQVAPPVVTPSSQKECKNEIMPVFEAGGENVLWYAINDTTSKSIFKGKRLRPVNPEEHTNEYFATQTIRGCQSIPTRAELYVKPLPEKPAIDDRTDCENASHYLLAKLPENATIEWFDGNGIIIGDDDKLSLNKDWLAKDDISTFNSNSVLDGCKSSIGNGEYVMISKPDKPDVVGDNIICLGTNAEPFTAFVNSPVDSIIWVDKNNLQLVQGEQFGTDYFNTVNRFKLKVYSYNKFCPSDASIKEVDVRQKPDPRIVGDMELCIVQDPHYYSVYNGDEDSDYDWTINDASINSKAIDGKFRTYFKEAGIYTISVVETDKYGCSGKGREVVKVAPDPQAEFWYYLNTEEQSVVLYNLSEQEELDMVEIDVDYKWIIDGSTDTIFQSEEEYDEDIEESFELGSHSVKLIAVNNFGCKDSVNHDFHVQGNVNLFFPNAFSPDHESEGVAVFQPKGINIETYQIWMYDMWGNLVWYSDKLTDDGQPAEGWDGYYKGVLMQTGVYKWKAQAMFTDGTLWKGNKTKNGEYSQWGEVIMIR